MGKVLTNPQHYADIAEAIRAKGGTTAQLRPDEMASAIAKLGVAKMQPLAVTENGIYLPDNGFDGFDSVSVNVNSTPAGLMAAGEFSLSSAISGSASTPKKQQIVPLSEIGFTPVFFALYRQYSGSATSSLISSVYMKQSFNYSRFTCYANNYGTTTAVANDVNWTTSTARFLYNDGTSINMMVAERMLDTKWRWIAIG